MLLAQECKAKFAVEYTDGQHMQSGLTPDQRKYWETEGAKKLKGMCLDFAKPDYLIVWSVGVSGKELAESGVGNFNRARETGEASTSVNQASSNKMSTTDSRWVDSTVFVMASSAVRAKADYMILDLSKNPASVIRMGQGYRDLPSGMGVASGHGEKINSQDLSSTIPDPAAALENALKWLKKEKKLLAGLETFSWAGNLALEVLIPCPVFWEVAGYWACRQDAGATGGMLGD